MKSRAFKIETVYYSVWNVFFKEDQFWISANPHTPSELTPTSTYEYITDIFVRHRLKRIYDY